MYDFSFDHECCYDGDEGISLPITIHTDKDSKIDLPAKLDTGSTYCIFQPEYAELLNLDLKAGEEEPIGTFTGSFVTYGHEINLKFLELEWSCVVYFSADKIPRNILGRNGFINKLKIALIDYEQRLFVSPAG